MSSVRLVIQLVRAERRTRHGILFVRERAIEYQEVIRILRLDIYVYVWRGNVKRGTSGGNRNQVDPLHPFGGWAGEDESRRRGQESGIQWIRTPNLVRNVRRLSLAQFCTNHGG